MIMLRSIAAVLTFTALVSLAGAQERAPVVTRVVIAPALSDTAKAIKLKLSASRSAGVEGAQDLYFFYGGRGFEPLWIESTGRASDRAKSLLAAIGRSDELGLEPRDYALPSDDGLNVADRELALTATAIRFGNENFGGRLRPLTLSSNLDMQNPRLPIKQLLALLAGDDPGKSLLELAPQDSEFSGLVSMLGTVEEVEPVVQIDEGPSLKPGIEDVRVPFLRERLGLAVPQDATSVYDDELVAAVMAFQLETGLTADGIVGNATREALNRGSAITREQLLVNLEKWRWLPRDRGKFRVEVNIPEYRLWVRNNGKTVYETKVVVGTSKNQTPIFYDQIRHVVVNPYWNVPSSIARSEVGPQVIRDPGYLARRQFELLTQDGTIIDPWTVNWSALTPGTFPFLIRQKPGVQNALGQVKFLFPNKHDVYLHDTPEKSLFGRDLRAYSHGCVRVENPFDFADALLANEPALSRDTLIEAFGPNEKWFNMGMRVPVFLTYFTVRVDEMGQARSYADIYGHDRTIAEALFESSEL